VARRRSASAEDAEDAVHEAMIRAAERPHLDDDRLGAWLTTVTVRLCADRYRQLTRDAEVHTRSVRMEPGLPTAEEAVCDQAEAKWLVDRSEDLPARQAEALGLRAQGLNLPQIAHRMDLSYRAVQSQLARARKTLRATLAATLAVTVWSWLGRLRAVWGPQTVTLVSAATLTVAGLSLPVLTDLFEDREAPAPQLRTDEAPSPPDRRLSKHSAAGGETTAPSQQQEHEQEQEAVSRLSGTDSRHVNPSGPLATAPAVPVPVPVPDPPSTPLPVLPELPDTLDLKKLPFPATQAPLAAVEQV
jgi:RNA polymerase sigma factor (sigma-70 family)